MIFPFKKFRPKIHPSVYVAPGAHVIGEVHLSKNASVWPCAVLRGDMGAVRVGEGTNIQDGAVLHGDHGIPSILGKNVTMGHQAVAHACRIGDHVLLGIGSRVLTGAEVGEFSLIGAGALVLENAKIPRRSLVLGVPGKVIRRLTDQEARRHVEQAKRYQEFAKWYKKYLG